MSSFNVCAHYVCTTYSFNFMLFDLLIMTRLVTNSLSSRELALFNFRLVNSVCVGLLLFCIDLVVDY